MQPLATPESEFTKARSFGPREDIALIKGILWEVSSRPPAAGAPGQWISREYPRQMMLTLLAFAYSRGVLASEQIEDRVPKDTMLRYVAAGRRPSAKLIRSFRRGHHDELQQILSSVLGPDEAERTLGRAILMDSVAADV